jgi:penicillin-binding protein 2
MLQRRPRIQQPRAQRTRRANAARAIIIIVVAFLSVPLYRLQVVSAEQYVAQARENRMRPVVVRAPRGTIYDRHGRIVAENTVGYQVLLMPRPHDLAWMREQVDRLTPVLGLDSAGIEGIFRRWNRARHLPMEVSRDADPIAVARLQERRIDFPGVLVTEYPKRQYPAGLAVGHIIGYVSEISEQELAMEDFADYEQGRWIGKAGLERQYERHLGGLPGVRYLEMDAAGRIRQWMPDEVGRPPVPGRDLQLYLDLDLQEYIASIFPRTLPNGRPATGAVVAIDPRTGGVLAYYSHPTFDPNSFSGGIPAGLWQDLMNDPRKPLLDRVSNSGQPAASTWKLIVAAMALDLGVIRPDEYMPVSCVGGIALLGRYARCWNASGHGRQNLIDGIRNSCNVYFYQVGARIGLDRFLEHGTRLGFAERTNIDIPTEFRPQFPENRQWWIDRLRYQPHENEILSIVIGQGPTTMTIIKLAQMYAALARPDGRMPAPRIAMGMDEGRDTIHFQLTPQQQWYLNTGMRRTVAPGGTAAMSRLRDWDFIGKTGTAQNPPNPAHGWFVGMGGPRGGEMEIAVTMFLEFAETGTIPSGYVGEIVNFYLDRKYNRPFQGWATPRWRFREGLPVQWNFFGPVEEPPMPPADATPEQVMAEQARHGATAVGGVPVAAGAVRPPQPPPGVPTEPVDTAATNNAGGGVP